MLKSLIKRFSEVKSWPIKRFGVIERLRENNFVEFASRLSAAQFYQYLSFS